jgi:hypothetical protein
MIQRRSKAWLQAIAAMMLSVLMTSSASAQSTRTWVSGVGDDANPGSRTAPCKTFAGAISKTAAGGEIDCLDPGGFGAVTITKSITIDGGGTFASILGSGTNGIVINAGANDVVTIRNLSINGAGSGLNGIRFIAGGALHIEDCRIFNFSQKGVDFEPSGNSRLFISDTVIRNNNNAVNGGAVFLASGAAGSVTATLNNVRMHQNTFGVLAAVRTTATIRNSTMTGQQTNGIFATGNASTPISIFVEGCFISDSLARGIRSDGTMSTVRISRNTVTHNFTGLAVNSGGQIISFGNNRIAGNTTDGAPTSTIPPK